MQVLSRKLKLEGKAIGFVPTMGALHEGHLSLVKQSKKENDITVVSIFVNPIQFGPKEDLKKYPRDIKRDTKKLSSLGVDISFIPESDEMYPDGFSTSVDVGDIGKILCGASRPGHFNGVATVVAKLFNIVMPHRAYFGQKDFQQTIVIKKLAEELNFDIDIVVCPTVREPDGLAMSSRNTYLSQKERNAARILFKALRHGENLVKNNIYDASEVRKEINAVIKSEPLADVEYIDIVDPATLEEMKEIRRPAAICLAVKIGATRLIDNVVIV